MRQALTLAEAARRLGVKPQRVSQMLLSGDLSGPATGPGRAPKGAPRVWESSLEREINRRSTDDRHVLRRDSQSNDGHPDVSTREAAALEAALRMKIRLDEAREALRQERRANKKLTSLLAMIVAELEAARAQADHVDGIAEGYSEALTQLLIPGESGNVF